MVNGKGLGFYCIYSKQFLYRKQTVNTALFIKVSLFSGLFGNLFGVNGLYIGS